MSDDAITQIAKIIDPDFDYESDGVQADLRQLAAECFSVILPTTMEIVSEREALRAENARLRNATLEEAAKIAEGRYWSSALGSDGTAKVIAAAIRKAIGGTK